MTKYAVTNETVWGGKYVMPGMIVEGKDLDKIYPKLFRKASAQESLMVTENKQLVSDKQIAKVLEQVKAAALSELEDKITENVMERVEKMLKAKAEGESPENEA